METYRTRMLDGLLDELLAAHPAIMLVGPRGSGKTTMAVRHARSVVRLDDPLQASLFRASPDVALARVPGYPVLLDEWQEVPAILGAIKRAVDTERGAGRFLLSGSVRAPFAGGSWPGTGRVIEIPMYPMSVRERLGRLAQTPFLRRLAEGEPEPGGDPPDIVGYLELALESGFPETLSLSDEDRQHWLGSYVDQLVSRDLQAVGYALEAPKLRRYLQSYAANSAGVCDHATIYRPIELTHRTAQRYEALLEALYITARLDSWSLNPLKQLAHQPKRFVLDPGLLARLLRADLQGVMANGALIGRLLETFVFAQIQPELPLDVWTRLSHLRIRGGRHEVDFIGELGGGRIVGIEVKATSAPRRDDAKHLIWLRDELGENFVRGAVLHTGPYTFELDDRILAVPICAIWA